MRLSRRALLAGCVSMMLPACRRSEPPPPAQQTVDLFIQSDGDFLAYKPDALTCPSGAIVRLTFHHGGKFLSARHNWVLVRPGQMEAVDKSVEHDEGLVSKDDPRVIAFTPMCDKGGSVMIQFTAPARGDYPFFCSTPGHGECMNGILHVI
jgi:azurin